MSDTAAYAFENIGRLYFPGNYVPGWLRDIFKTNNAPDSPTLNAAAPVPANDTGLRAQFRSTTAAHTLAQFWDSHVGKDGDCKYVKDNENGSAGGVRFFNTRYPYNNEQVLDVKLTLRTNNNPEDTECSMAHELIHVRSMIGDEPTSDKAPNGADILFANLANSASPIVLSPRSQMQLMRIIEGDAGVKTAWLSSLSAESHPAFLQTLEWDSISTKEFLEIQGKTDSLQEALRKGAATAMTNHWGYGPNNGAWDFGDYYENNALNSYDIEFSEKRGQWEWNALRLHAGEQIEFVDIDFSNPDDMKAVLKIANSFGPNPFEDENGGLHADFTIPKPFKPEIEARLQKIEEHLGIAGKKLRSYSQAMKAWEISPQEYMSYAMGGKNRKAFPFQEEYRAPRLNLPAPQMAANTAEAALPVAENSDAGNMAPPVLEAMQIQPPQF